MLATLDTPCSEELDSLQAVCAHCGAQCHYLKQDRVQYGAHVFVERRLTCVGCGRAEEFPVLLLLGKPEEPCSL